ncbi:DNA-processing protein DprA [Sphingomonas prati]|uniref:DNA processing protein n=1 Tax=Sphingomonas prati TaxID=1843237 RepID=A0A7W9BPC1_9SPHN|nr:DNA-processing protein DprA [Sphingomonas prati]MBB5727634.1 DNA processing protein [Sphingomonas prati]GGE79561.1 DNA processing protein DprA [Sphingomonas prati]
MSEPSLYDDRIARLRLIRTGGIGPVTYKQLIARFGTPAAALAALPDLARRGGGKAPPIATLATVEAEVEAVERLGARYLFMGQGLYPALLARIETAPPALILRGRTALLERPAVAIVGARNASAAAVRFARGLAAELADAGLLVVSGLARGIDTAAHQGAGAARTAGVIAGGIDIVYPPENAELQRAIAEGGLLLAEQPPGTEPRARHFPYRNRIIAGLAGGTVVVEAAPRSGSLITARLASEYGCDVMAVPGSPLDPRAQGCNLLIREGAVLVQSAADVIEALGPIGGAGAALGVAMPASGYDAPPAADADDRERARVTGLLGPTAVAVDELIRQAALAPAIVQTVLLELELGGRLERHAGGRVSLIG